MNMDFVWVLVPLTALSIPLFAVVGRVVVKPIADAIGRLGNAEQTAIAAARAEQRFAETDARLARIEQLLARALAEQQAQRRQLESGQELLQPPPLHDARTPVSR